MSKYDQYVKEYLLKNSELSIEKIGDFTLSPAAAGEKTIQPQFISFQFDKRAQTSEGLVEYIATQTGKNKTLVSSDLTSTFDEARQYANIGKAYSIAGLGNISLNRQGGYDFSPGTIAPTAPESTYTNRPETETVNKAQKGRNFVILIAFLIIVLVAGGLGWGIYKYLNQKKPDGVTTDTLPAATDTAKVATTNKDSTVLTPAVNKPGGDTAEYKFIFETTFSSLRAYKRYDSLKAWKENCLLDSARQDSGMVYHLYVKMKVSSKDTTAVKDSLQKYYDRPVPIIIKHG